MNHTYTHCSNYYNNVNVLYNMQQELLSIVYCDDYMSVIQYWCIIIVVLYQLDSSY